MSSVKKKFKEKSFAPGVARGDIESVEDDIGISMDELFRLGIEGIQAKAQEVGLVA